MRKRIWVLVAVVLWAIFPMDLLAAGTAGGMSFDATESCRTDRTDCSPSKRISMNNTPIPNVSLLRIFITIK